MDAGPFVGFIPPSRVVGKGTDLKDLERIPRPIPVDLVEEALLRIQVQEAGAAVALVEPLGRGRARVFPGLHLHRHRRELARVLHVVDERLAHGVDVLVRPRELGLDVERGALRRVGAGDRVREGRHEFRVEAVAEVAVEDEVVRGGVLELGDLVAGRPRGELGDERRRGVAVVVRAELEPAAHERLREKREQRLVLVRHLEYGPRRLRPLRQKLQEAGVVVYPVVLVGDEDAAVERDRLRAGYDVRVEEERRLERLILEMERTFMIYFRAIRVITFYFAVFVVIERQVIKIFITLFFDVNAPFKFYWRVFVVHEVRYDDVPIRVVDEVGVDAAVAILVQAKGVEVGPSPGVGVVFVLVVVQELYDQRGRADVRAAEVIPVPELVSLHRAAQSICLYTFQILLKYVIFVDV